MLSFLKKYKNKHTLKDILSVFVFRFSGLLLAYAANIYIAQEFGKEVYGYFATSLTLLQIIGALACLGLSELVIKFTADVVHSNQGIPNHSFLKDALAMVLIASVVFAIVTYFLAEILAIQVFSETSLIPFFKSLAWFLPFYALHFVLTSYWQGSRKFRNFGIFRFTLPYIVFFLGIFVLQQRFNPFLYYMVSFPTLFAIECFISKKQIFSKVKQKYTKKYLLNISYPMMLSSIILFSLSWLDIIMLGIMKNQSIVGEYQAAFKLASIVMMIIMVANIVIAPIISSLYSQNKIKELFGFVKKITRATTALATLASIPFLLFPNQIMEFTFGKVFANTGNLLFILTISNIVNTSFGSVDLVMNMTRHQKVFQNIVIFKMEKLRR